MSNNIVKQYLPANKIIKRSAVTTEKISINADLDFGGKAAKNLTIHSGSDYPTTPIQGQLFMKKSGPTDPGKLYVYAVTGQ